MENEELISEEEVQYWAKEYPELEEDEVRELLECVMYDKLGKELEGRVSDTQNPE